MVELFSDVLAFVENTGGHLSRCVCDLKDGLTSHGEDSLGREAAGPRSTLGGLCNAPSRSRTVLGPFVPSLSRWDAATAAAVSVSLSGDAPSPGTNRTRGA